MDTNWTIVQEKLAKHGIDMKLETDVYDNPEQPPKTIEVKRITFFKEEEVFHLVTGYHSHNIHIEGEKGDQELEEFFRKNGVYRVFYTTGQRIYLKFAEDENTWYIGGGPLRFPYFYLDKEEEVFSL